MLDAVSFHSCIPPHFEGDSQHIHRQKLQQNRCIPPHFEGDSQLLRGRTAVMMLYTTSFRGGFTANNEVSKMTKGLYTTSFRGGFTALLKKVRDEECCIPPHFEGDSQLNSRQISSACAVYHLISRGIHSKYTSELVDALYTTSFRGGFTASKLMP